MKPKQDKKIKRNLKIFNHWIAELRDIAIKIKVRTDGRTLMKRKEVNQIFNKADFQRDFIMGLTPEQAFWDEMDNWKDNQ